MERPFFTIREVCELTGRSRSTVYELIAAGELERIYLPPTPRARREGAKRGRPRVTRESLEGYLEKCNPGGGLWGRVLGRLGLMKRRRG